MLRHRHINVPILLINVHQFQMQLSSTANRGGNFAAPSHWVTGRSCSSINVAAVASVQDAAHLHG
ncbi:MAG TPA: hypothetical protein DDX19_03190 [Rhodopirellula baltica]|uniref:Uncharacterized protein n=1 Tax=Rhodopirellula baltica (strain DSM 10527 / NCIMB 13988 / SH1) TaxID=243090 RepID=Q7UUF2_RHOBA|nr:hypothetical protein RB3329 [Rhodopirellula baltica SH 1]HBE61774.1 hypothetical protein [Rhodopirellula baltica]